MRMFLDIECYRNYFLVMFLSDDGRVGAYEMYDGHPLNTEAVYRLLTYPGLEHYTFNGTTYDIPLIQLAMNGATCADLKSASDNIIENNLKHWQFEKMYPTQRFQINHVDLIEVAPGQNSLKMYGGRLHCDKLQDLPFDPSDEISEAQRPIIRTYCRNDLRVTKALADSLREQIDLRRTLREHLVEELEQADLAYVFTPDDLRSKSDAQIAESVLKQRVFVKTGIIPRKHPVAYKKFRYEPPPYIKFTTPVLQEALGTIVGSDMLVKETGHVAMPEAIEKLAITIGTTTYKMGLGGIHSQESEVSLYSDDESYLRDIDVVSYYPNLMLNMGMYPDTMGPHFLHAYREILDERVSAKRSGDSVKAALLKITLNGTFGKTASKYSVLYNPKMMIATTITGQLSVLMLIEAFEKRGVKVVSANTDGIVVHCRRDKEALQRRIVKAWEQLTNLETEETDYKSIHSRDVNSYIAVKTDGKIKTKGFFAKSGLAKSPQNDICTDAAVAYITSGTPVEETIRQCADLTKFLTVRRVTGGAVKDGEPVGKTIRWYYSTKVVGPMHYLTSGNVVPRSVGARAALNMPDQFPDDIDYDWYAAEANERLMAIGVVPRVIYPKLPRRNTLLWKKLEGGGLVEVDDYGVPRWAVHLDDIPEEHRHL